MPGGGGRKDLSPEERFWAKVKKGPDCWLWTGKRNGHGYGMFWLDGRSRPAHRVSFEWAYGAIPDGAQLDHLCRTRACIKPEHLEAVDCRTNLLRGVGMAGRWAARTHCECGLPLVEAPPAMQKFRRRRYCPPCHKSRIDEARRRARQNRRPLRRRR